MYASNEERYFAGWLDELVDKGLVISYEYEPDPFILLDPVKPIWNKQLKTKIKSTDFSLFQQVIYTTDFKVVWNTRLSDGILTFNDVNAYKKRPLFYLPDSVDCTYFEVKPSFDANNMTRAAKIKIAWVKDKYDINIELVKPKNLFDKTFYPEEYLLNDSKSSDRTKTVRINKKKKRVAIRNLKATKVITDFVQE